MAIPSATWNAIRSARSSTRSSGGGVTGRTWVDGIERSSNDALCSVRASHAPSLRGDPWRGVGALAHRSVRQRPRFGEPGPGTHRGGWHDACIRGIVLGVPMTVLFVLVPLSLCSSSTVLFLLL